MDWPAEHARAHRIIDAVLKACDPRPATAQAAREQGLKPAPVLAIGKAAYRMAQGLEDALGQPPARLIITTENSPGAGEPDVFLSDHPLPTERSLEAGRRVKAFIDAAKAAGATSLTVLLSGGASALIAEPIPGVSLDEYNAFTKILLGRGVDIHRLNTFRRAFDALKGGGLAAYAHPLHINLFILSDVPGDHPHDIGSGPFSPNPTTPADAAAVLREFIREDIVRDLESSALSAPKLTVPAVSTHVIAGSPRAVSAASTSLQAEGLMPWFLRDGCEGDVSKLWADINSRLSSMQPGQALAYGGEWEIGACDGFGGRMQFLAATLCKVLPRQSHWVIVALATDGVDGVHPPGEPPAAGVIATSQTFSLIESIPDWRSWIFDKAHFRASYTYNLWQAVDALAAERNLGITHHLFTGPTGTNVNDLLIAWRC